MNTSVVWNDQVPERDGVRNPINDTAISPDGTRLVVAVGNRVLLYNTETGDLIESLKGHKDQVYCVSFSHDGSRFSSGGADKVVIIWKITGQGMLKYNHTATIQRVRYNPTKLLLASCSEVDFGLWTPDQKQVVKEKVPSKILSAAWTGDGQILALGLLNGWISLRNSAADEIHRIERKAPIWCLEFVPSAFVTAKGAATKAPGSPGKGTGQELDMLVVGCWDKTLSLYRINDNAHRLQGERSLRYYPCSLSIANIQGNKTNYMIISGSNKKTTLYSREGTRLAELAIKDSWVWSSVYHDDSDRVVVGTDSGGIDMLQMTYDVVHSLYKDRYAYRENLTEVVIHHLITDRKVRIKCRDYVNRISLYKNKCAVQLSDKVCIYESSVDDPLDINFRLRRERISTHVPCETMHVTSQHMVFCIDRTMMLYTFDGQRLRTWEFDSSIGCSKVDGGPETQEIMLLGLNNGQVLKVIIDNPFPIEIAKREHAVKSADLSLNRDKLIIVDSDRVLTVLDLKSHETVYVANGATSACFNTEADDMLCYTGDSTMYVVSGLVGKSDEKKAAPEPQEQHMTGTAIGFSGQKIYCLHKTNIIGLDVPQGANITRLLDLEDYKGAYGFACLGATEADWRVLGMRALRANQLDIAKNAYARLKDVKYLRLIEAIEKDTDTTPKVAERIPAPTEKRGRHQAAAAATVEITKAPLDMKWQAELLAFDGHLHEAAKLYARAGKLDEAIRLFVDMKLWNDAKMFAQNSGAKYDLSSLNHQQAKWLQEINDWRGASQLYLTMGQYMQAARLIAESIGPENGWQNVMLDVVRATPQDMVEVLSYCGEILSNANEDAMAKEAYIKLGDISKLMALYVKRQMWTEAAKLADEHEGKFESSVFLPYAEWLIMMDRFEDAIVAYKKAGRPDLSRKVLHELTMNAVIECRFKDASYYFWLLSKDLSASDDNETLQMECEHKSDLYYAYAHIHAYVTDPFTSHHPEVLFQVSRFIINSMGSSETIPYGISIASTLYTLGRQSMALGAFKLARHIFDRLGKLQIPERWEEEVEHEMLIVQAKPVRDEPELLPACFRCSSTNPLLNPFTNKFSKGDVCTNCGHPFVRSFINFDILPLVEFVPDPSISDEEAIELIRTPPGDARSRAESSGWNEGKVGESDTLTFDNGGSKYDDDYRSDGGDTFSRCLNRTLEKQMNAMSYVPVTVDANTLIQMKRGDVYVCRPSTPNKRATFYKNMLPEIAIAISQSCHRFFHLEDFEFAYLSNKSCPFSRLSDVGEYGSL